MQILKNHQSKASNKVRPLAFYSRSGAGFTLTETLIVGALFGLFVLAGTMFLGAERARTRDAKRVADMTRLAAGFSMMFSQKATFAEAAVGCAVVGVPAQSCTLTDVISGIEQIQDPSRFAYTVVRVPDREDFGIKFHLERTYGTLKAGDHILTKTGIH